MTPERRAKLRRIAQYAVENTLVAGDVAAAQKRLAAMVIECLDDMEAVPKAKLNAFLDEYPAPARVHREAKLKPYRKNCTFCEGKGSVWYGDKNTGFAEDCNECLPG